MRVGLYCRQLISVGGGNRHSLAIAEHLSKNHEVDIITHTPFGVSQTVDKLNLDLSRTHLRIVPTQPDHALGWLTEEYDLFINRLHNMFIPCRAPHGIMFVLFPVQVHLDWMGRVRRTVARQLLKRLFQYDFHAGIYGEEYLGPDRMWLLSNPAEIRLKPARHAYAAHFRVHNPSPEDRQVEIWLDGELLQQVAAPGRSKSAPCHVTIPAGHPGQDHRLCLKMGDTEPVERIPVSTAIERGFPNLRLTDFRLSHPSFRMYNRLFEHWLPHWRDRLLNVPPNDALEQIASYNLIWANSEFTRRWIREYWQRESTVIYPLVEVDAIQPMEKKQWILSVGRYFVAAHNKKHLVMMEAFKELCRQGLEGWELHLAGEVIDDPIHQEYFRTVRAAAQGYPIHVHTNVPFDRLKRLYGESALYWHAAGFGEDEESNPIRHEHFGMTTVEAMAAGCVPVVIGKGGQREIITHGTDGFLWQSIAELQRFSMILVQDARRRNTMSAAAIQRSRHFDRTHFQAQIDDSLAELGLDA